MRRTTAQRVSRRSPASSWQLKDLVLMVVLGAVFGRYRSYNRFVYALSGLVGAGLVFFYSGLRFGWYGQDIFFLRLGLQLLSGLALGGLLAKVVVDALLRTGVLDNFAIGRARVSQAAGRD